MAGWDFTADSDKQTELSKNLNEAADNFDEKVNSMYSEVSTLSSYWVGEDYDLFVERTESYKTALQDLSNGIRMFSTHFESMATGTDELASSLIAIIQDLTGSGANASSGGSSSNSADSTLSTTSETEDNTGGSEEAVSGGDSGEDASDGNTSETATGIDSDTSSETVTYASGDTLSIDGTTYNYYGAYEKSDGSVVHLLTDTQNNLYYVDSNGDIQPVTVDLSAYSSKSNDIAKLFSSLDDGTQVNVTKAGEISSGFALAFNDDGVFACSVSVYDSYENSKSPSTNLVTSSDQLASTVSVSGAAIITGATSTGSSGASYMLENSNTITSDGSTKSSVSGAVDGSTVNGATYRVVTQMSDFTTFAESNDDVVVCIPQGTSVQWDRNSRRKNGFDIDTSSGSAYLRWSSEDQCYYLCDEYGNYNANSKQLTLDGFNTKYGEYE